MARERLFTDEELKELGRHTSEVLEEAIEAGDGEGAKKLVHRMYREFLAMHDLYRDWITGLLTFIGRRYGDEVLSDAFVESFGPPWLDLLENFTQDDPRRAVQMLASGLKGHLQPLRIEEDDEKVTLTMTPCGSGGRMFQSSYYGPPRDYLKIKKAQPMTFDQEDYPVYCAHSFFMNAVPIWAGKKLPYVAYDCPGMGEVPSCRLVVYKDPSKAVPPDIRESVERAKRKR